MLYNYKYEMQVNDDSASAQDDWTLESINRWIALTQAPRQDVSFAHGEESGSWSDQTYQPDPALGEALRHGFARHDGTAVADLGAGQKVAAAGGRLWQSTA